MPLSIHANQASLLFAIALGAAAVSAQEESPRAFLKAVAQPFLDAHCVRCHGAEKQKGDITLHDLQAGPAAARDAERWELVLDMLRSGEMPPEEEPQPDGGERQRLVAWVDRELRARVASQAAGDALPTTRRLTNAEYHNTMRDLLGVELQLTDNLPEDPVRPYRANNTADFLLMGLEQIDRYEENARRAMASVIVDPAEPKIHRARQSWAIEEQRYMPDPTAMQRDEIGVFGNRNRTVANGMRIFEWPETGAFRLRIKASAILPEGVTELPLRVMLGHDIVGIGASDLSPAELVGTLRVKNRVDEPEVYELTGRIENFPSKPEHRYRRGGKIDGRLVITPPHFTVTALNVYDDGTLNDRPDPLTMPRAVVEWMEFEAPVFAQWPPAHHARILFESPLRASDPRAYVRAVLERFLARAFRRPVTEAEVARYEQIHQIVADELGLKTLEASMRETLAMALVSPEFLYHVEGRGHPQHELACRLSYFLWRSMPDAELLELARRGELRDPKVIAKQARRLLADGRAQEFVRGFTSNWLSLSKLPAVPINLERFPRFLYTIARGERRGQEIANRPTVRDYMREETFAFVAELIRENESLLRVVDSEFAMLNQRLAVHYGVEGVMGHELRRVSVRPEHHLGGLLTQGAFLVGTSTGTAPHPVYRGVWLREAILGDEVPDPPADVPALEESAGETATAATSLKDLLRIHRTKESCRDCHARLDPWGIPFEEYDATGRFSRRVPPLGGRVQGFDARTHKDLEGYRAYLEELSSVAVDASAKLPNGPEVEGVAELKRYLLEHRGDDIARNLVRRLLSFSLGRRLGLRDRFVVDQLVRDAAKNGYKLQDLIISICQTDAFLGGDPK